jgi:DMSO reductase anchor subunit
VYVATRREQWSAAQTGIKFFGTTLVLGCAAVFLVSAFTLRLAPGSDGYPLTLLWVVLGVGATKLAFEAGALLRVRERRNSALKRMALVMLGDLRRLTLARFACGALGAIALPVLMCSVRLEASATRACSVGLLAALLAGELLERYLFFRAAPASRMPGGLR